jgi:hypothetical protein
LNFRFFFAGAWPKEEKPIAAAIVAASSSPESDIVD